MAVKLFSGTHLLVLVFGLRNRLLSLLSKLGLLAPFSDPEYGAMTIFQYPKRLLVPLSRYIARILRLHQ
jgi:hypothetical protein